MTGGTKATKPRFIYRTKPAVFHNMGLTETGNNEEKCMVIKWQCTLFKEKGRVCKWFRETAV